MPAQGFRQQVIQRTAMLYPFGIVQKARITGPFRVTQNLGQQTELAVVADGQKQPSLLGGVLFIG